MWWKIILAIVIWNALVVLFFIWLRWYGKKKKWDQQPREYYDKLVDDLYEKQKEAGFHK